MRIAWLKDAVDDLENIYRFVAEQSETSAVKLYNHIYDQVEKLMAFPEMGVIEPLLSKKTSTYRSLIVKRSYKIVYKYEKEIVFIIAVWDCRQNPKKLKGKIAKNK